MAYKKIPLDIRSMELKGRDHARKIQQLRRTIEHAYNLSDKHYDYANLHDTIGEDPQHPKHKSPEHHRAKYEKHREKSKLLRAYVQGFKDELGED
jgi:hypothetical protein